MLNSRACLFLLAFLLGGAVTARADVIVYQQPSNFPANNLVSPHNGVYASQNDTTQPGAIGNFATAYDSFVLSQPATISSVNWQGGYFDPAQRGNITAFTL